MCLRIFRTKRAKERERQEIENRRLQSQIDTLGATISGLELSIECIKNAIEENKCMIQEMQQHTAINMDTTDGDDTKQNKY